MVSGLRMHRILGATFLLGLAILSAPVLPEGGIDLDTRVGALEARLESLTQRVAAMESVLKDQNLDTTGAPGAKAAPAWVFDGYVQGSPFRVLQHDLDRISGRVDLLLDVAAPLPNPEQWATTVRGTAVPLVLVAEPPNLGPGTSTVPIPLFLERATRVAPGARLHLRGQLDPARAQSVRQIRVGRAESEAPGIR
jgi:hypothetical protein